MTAHSAIPFDAIRRMLLVIMAGSFACIHTGDAKIYMPLMFWLIFMICFPPFGTLIAITILAGWGYLLLASCRKRLRQQEFTLQLIITMAIPPGLVFLLRIQFLSAPKESLLCWLPCLIFAVAGYFYILIRNH